jgi:trimethylamine--corrinoid protein Co-methyltransferase
VIDAQTGHEKTITSLLPALAGSNLIHKIGSGKNSLKEKHTLKYMTTEQSKVKLFDRRTRGSWEKKGGTDVATRANAS